MDKEQAFKKMAEAVENYLRLYGSHQIAGTAGYVCIAVK